MNNQQAQPQTIAVEKVTVKATHIAQRCVVCNGFGSLAHGMKICHACKGQGYILIPCEPYEERRR